MNKELIPKRLSCGACRVSSEVRVANGCDSPSEHVLFYTKCSTCYGSDPYCSTCNGKLVQGFNRCPSKIIDAETAYLLYLFGQMENGLHPSRGGLLTLPNDFVELHRHFLTMRNLLEKEEFDKQQKEIDKLRKQGNKAGKK